MLRYSEKWVVTINRKEWILDETEKPRLEQAMKNQDRWFKTKKGDILSVAHIETVELNSKQIANQLEEGERSGQTERVLTPDELHKKIEALKERI